MSKFTFKPISADELLRKKFPPARLVVDGVLPVGLSLLAGRPKIGKSWLALNLGLAVSSGAPFLGRSTVPGSVLYLALEDGDRRVQARLAKMLGSTKPPKNLFLQTECPAMDEGGKEALEGWLQQCESRRLVVVDVFQRVRPRAKSGSNYYADDYSSVLGLKALADAYDVAVVAVCHTRKADPGMDPFDAISATTGLVGAADHAMILDRTPTGIGLYGRGRDLEEFDLAVSFDPSNAHWSAIGDRDAVGRSDTRNAIIAALEQAGTPIGPAEIAKISGLADDVVRQRLKGLVQAGDINKSGRGLYSPLSTPVTTVTTVTTTETARLPLPPSLPSHPDSDFKKKGKQGEENVTVVTVVTGVDKGIGDLDLSLAPSGAPSDDADEDEKYLAFTATYERLATADLSPQQLSLLRRNLEMPGGLRRPEAALIFARDLPDLPAEKVAAALAKDAAPADAGGVQW